MVPRRPRLWRNGSVATNQPKPCRESTSPSSRSTSSARRTVTRLAAYVFGQLRLGRQQPRPLRGRPTRVAGAGRPRCSGTGSGALVLYLSTYAGGGKRPPVSPPGPPPWAEAHERLTHNGSRREHPHRAGQRRLRAPRRAGGAGPGAPRSPPDLRREDPDQPPPRPRDRRHRAGPQLHRPRPRPRRHAGRHRPDGAAAVHDRRPAPGGRALHRALRPPHPGQGATASIDLPPPSTATPRSTTSSSRSRPSTASASGSRAAASSTRSCSSSTPSPAG